MNYPTTAILELHHAGIWHQAAELQALSHDRVRFSYLDSYVFGDVNLPVSLTVPVKVLWAWAAAGRSRRTAAAGIANLTRRENNLNIPQSFRWDLPLRSRCNPYD